MYSSLRTEWSICFLYFAEGFLTTCSFDYLTDDDHTRYFVAIIFVWAYVIPLLLIVFFYIQLLGHVRGHERMLKEQVRSLAVLLHHKMFFWKISDYFFIVFLEHLKIEFFKLVVGL